MEAFEDGMAIVFEGHDLSRADAIAQASEFLLSKGHDEFDVEGWLFPQPHRVVRAWYGVNDDGEPCFVGELNDDNAHHNPRPVTVVNVEK